MCYISCPLYILRKYLTCFTKRNSLPRNSNTFEMKGAFQCYLTNILQHYRSLFCKHFYSAYGRGRIKIIKIKIKKTTHTHQKIPQAQHTTTKHQTGKEVKRGYKLQAQTLKHHTPYAPSAHVLAFSPAQTRKQETRKQKRQTSP